MAANPQEWWQSLPTLTKVWLGAAVFTGVGAKLGWLARGALLVHDWHRIVSLREVWRLVTPFAYFGMPSFGWLMQARFRRRRRVAARGYYIFFYYYYSPCGACRGPRKRAPTRRNAIASPPPLLRRSGCCPTFCPRTSATRTRAAAASTAATSRT